MNLLEQRLQEATTHIRREAAWQALSSGLIAGSVCNLALLMLVQSLGLNAAAAVSPLFVIPAILTWRAFQRHVSRHTAASLVDRCYGLPDSACSAIMYQQLEQAPDEKPRSHKWRALQLEDTLGRLAVFADSVNDLVPTKSPRFWPLSVTLTSFSLFMAWLAFQQQATLIAENRIAPAPETQAAAQLVESAINAAAELGITSNSRPLNSRSSEEESARPSPPQNTLDQLSVQQAVLDDIINSLTSNQNNQARNLRALGAALQLDSETNSAGVALQEERWKDAAKLIRELTFEPLSEAARRGIAAEVASLRHEESIHSEARLREAAAQLAEGLVSADEEKLRSAQATLAEIVDLEAEKAELSVRLNADAARLANLRSQLGQGASRVAGDLRRRDPAESDSATTDSQSSSNLLVLPDSPLVAGSTAPDRVPLRPQELELLRTFGRKDAVYTQQAEDVLRGTRIPAGQRRIVQRYFDSLRNLQTEANEASP